MLVGETDEMDVSKDLVYWRAEGHITIAIFSVLIRSL